MTKKNLPLSTQLIRWGYPCLEKISTHQAHRWAIKKFFTPFKPIKLDEKVRRLIKESCVKVMPYNGEELMVYRWGEGPIVYLIHGWSGRGLQFSNYIERLVKAGYRVVVPDFIAHGLSSGKQTNALEMAAVIKNMGKHFGYPKYIIGHSLGAVASVLSVLEFGVCPEKLAMISAPSDTRYISEAFRQKLNASVRLKESLESHISHEFNRPFKDFSIVDRATEVDIPILMIHDRKDREVPAELSQRLASKIKTSSLVLTEGLGHTRILNDPAVLESVVNFITS